MRSSIASGIVAGLAGGIVLGTMLTFMTQDATAQGFVTLMGLVARDVGSTRLAVGWLVELGVCAALGALFGALCGRRPPDAGAVASRALFFGLVLWGVSSLVGVPMLYGLPPVRGVVRSEVFPWIPALLAGWLLFVSVLAASFVWLGQRRRPAVRSASPRDIRRAA
jgi:hypothetical protein